MNRVRAFLSVLFIFAFACAADAQGSNKKSSQKRTVPSPVLCRINGLAFQCPKGFTSFFKNEEAGLWLFRENTDKKFGLFVSVPKTTFSENDLFDDLTKTVLAKIFPTQPQNYEWAASETVQFPDNEPMSKNQISSKTVKGYNKRHLVLGNLRHIAFNEKHFVVGYFIETDKGKDAAEQFENNFADAGYVTCNSQLQLIYSVTGEKLKKDEDPCEVTVTVAQ